MTGVNNYGLTPQKDAWNAAVDGGAGTVTVMRET